MTYTKNIVEIQNIFIKYGYTYDKNISDFYFENQNMLMEMLFGSNTYNDSVGVVVRWESPIGKACRQAIINFISNVQKEKMERNNLDSFAKNNYNIDYATINFENFTFEFENKNYTLEDFVNLFSTSKMRPHSDLRGIDLSGIRFFNCFFSNCNFGYANFAKCILHQPVIHNSLFNNVRFDDAKLISVNNDLDSTFHNSVFDRADIHLFNLNNRSISGIKFTKLTYLSLVIYFLKFVFKKNPYAEDIHIRWTHFLLNTEGLTSPSNKEIKDYIDWYESVISNIGGSRNESFYYKIKIFLLIISTKYWSSYYALGFFSLCLNLLFAALVFANRGAFFNMENASFLKAYYYCIVTFTTLGYGDVYPTKSLGYILVMIIVITGYIVLGLFLFLLSKKIDKSY